LRLAVANKRTNKQAANKPCIEKLKVNFSLFSPGQWEGVVAKRLLQSRVLKAIGYNTERGLKVETNKNYTLFFF